MSEPRSPERLRLAIEYFEKEYAVFRKMDNAAGMMTAFAAIRAFKYALGEDCEFSALFDEELDKMTSHTRN